MVRYKHVYIYQWESIMETFYLKDMQNSKLLHFSTVPWLLKDPRPHQVKQTQDESYINHYSVYCTVRAEFMFVSHSPVLCASEIDNVMEGSTIDIFHFCINGHGCTLRPRLFFLFFLFYHWSLSSKPRYYNVGVILYDQKRKKKKKKNSALPAKSKPWTYDVSTHKI